MICQIQIHSILKTFRDLINTMQSVKEEFKSGERDDLLISQHSISEHTPVKLDLKQINNNKIINVDNNIPVEYADNSLPPSKYDLNNSDSSLTRPDSVDTSKTRNIKSSFPVQPPPQTVIVHETIEEKLDTPISSDCSPMCI